MKTELKHGEQLIKHGSANLQRGIETVGGKLYLSNKRLVFEAHQFNAQSATTEVDLSTIQSTQPCWSKFLGLFPIFPNSLAIDTTQGAQYRFVLFGRVACAGAIEAQLPRRNTSIVDMEKQA
jgi:hypothetical protein